MHDEASSPLAPAEPLRFSCPHCARGLRVPLAMAGQRLRCPGCHGVVTAPVEQAPPAFALESHSSAPANATPALEATGATDPEPVKETNFRAAPPPPVRRAEDAVPSAEVGADAAPGLESPSAADASWPVEPVSLAETAPPRRPWNVVSPFCGLVGAGLLVAGAFYPLVLVTRPEFRVQHVTIQVVFEPYWVLPVQIGAVLLGIAVLAVTLARQYWGFWVLGFGTLLSLAVTYVFFFHVRIREVASESARWERAAIGQDALAEQVVLEATKSFAPGMAFAFFAGGAACLLLGALFARWLDRRYAYR